MNTPLRRNTNSPSRRLHVSLFPLNLLHLLPLALVLGWHGAALAEARLMVSPTRVVFEGNMRTTEVTLINSGDSTGTFRISFERKRMTAEGGYVDVPENEEGMFADPYIRFSPRQVTLPPGKSQTVRLMLRKPGDLAQGEYRSHMLFQSIPDAAATSIESQVKEEKDGVTVRLIPILGISIPVIVRQGKLEAEVTLAQLAYQPAAGQDPAALAMQFERTGSKSVYGDVIVKFRSRANGKEFVVGMAKGVAVLMPNTSRSLVLRLQAPQGVELHDGELVVEYRQSESEGGKLLASSRTPLPTTNK